MSNHNMSRTANIFNCWRTKPQLNIVGYSSFNSTQEFLVLSNNDYFIMVDIIIALKMGKYLPLLLV